MKPDLRAEPHCQADLAIPDQTSNPAPNFDRLARVYRWMEWASFGPFLWWCRCAFLSEMRGRRRALVIGDGDGRFTTRLLETNPAVQIDAIDASAAMLRALMRRAGAKAVRVRAIRDDIRRHARLGQVESSARYDLVVTHFLLDCLCTGEIRTLAERVRMSVAWDAAVGRLGVRRSGGVVWALGGRAHRGRAVLGLRPAYGTAAGPVAGPRNRVARGGF